MFCSNRSEASNEYDKDLVIDACKRVLKDIQSQREEMHEKSISRKMKKRRWLFGRNFTCEEAISRLKEINGITSSWNAVECIYGAQERTAEAILDVATFSKNDTVWLTKSEANALHWYE